MGVIMCCRCDKYVDLDWNVDDVVVMPDKVSCACFDCLTEPEHEYLEETGEFDLQEYKP